MKRILIMMLLCSTLVCAKGTPAGAHKAAVKRASERASGALVRVQVRNAKGKSVWVWRKP